MSSEIEQQINKVRSQIQAAREEFDMAVLYHEVWKPMAYDVDLHTRMGESLASNAFRIIKSALRREMLLAIGRVWDSVNGAPQLERMAHLLNERAFREKLLAERIANVKLSPGSAHLPPEFWQQLDEGLEVAMNKSISILNKWSHDGGQNMVRKRFKALRNQFLAHRQVALSFSEEDGLSDEEVNEYYNDTSEVIQLLLNLCLAVTYNPSDTGYVYRKAAELFWAGARGERTEGHPSFVDSTLDRH